MNQKTSMSDALSESAREMDFILGNLKDHAIFLIDAKGVIRSWNTGSERVFGYKDSEAIGQSFATIFTPEDVQAGIPERELSTAQAEGKAEDERWHERKDKSRFWASGAVVPLQESNGEPRYVKVVRDATDRKRAEDADRMESIGRLAGGVAHDYNNMLTSIIGYGELLAASISEDSPHQGWLLEILESARRAASLTRDLLAFSRRQMITPEPTNINEILFRVQGRLRLTLGERVALRIESDPGLETALLDKSQIEQLLMNLALNAKEAMPEGGLVTISTQSAIATEAAARQADTAGAATARSSAIALSAASIANVGQISPGPTGEKGEAERSAYITLIFKDNGKGMDAETTAHAFDPFFSTKPKSTGSVGLGLSTGYGIVQQSGGTISVTSVPGSGTEFVIHLPVSTEAHLPPARESELWAKGPIVPAGMGNARKKTILLVEDEVAVRKLASEVLLANGYQILEAGNGEEGLAIFRGHATGIDAVVTDLVMPKMGGLALARHILAGLPDTPIVFMSGYPDDPLISLDTKHRCVFLQKPFSVAELLAKVGEVFSGMAMK
ncbi:MAG: PAS domain S-box protein [Fibrobacteres bacterium]|nr:PAS domain S-box protein [Fibrobacterota bacterium]